MAYKIIRTFTLPEGSTAAHYQEQVEFREWFEQVWAGGGKHIITETTLSEDGRIMTKTYLFATKEDYTEFRQDPKVIAANADRLEYNHSNDIDYTASFYPNSEL